MLYPSSCAEFLKTFQLISTACCCCQDFCKLGQKLNFEKKTLHFTCYRSFEKVRTMVGVSGVVKIYQRMLRDKFVLKTAKNNASNF